MDSTVFKTTGRRKLTIVPVAVTDDEPGPSTRRTPSLALHAVSSHQSPRTRSSSESRPLSPNSQPIPRRASSLQPPHFTSTTLFRKPLSALSHAPPSSSDKGKRKQTSIPPSSLRHSSPSRDVFGSRDVQDAPVRRNRQPTDITLPLPLRETPLIEKNREMRSKASERRRNSLEHRRRASESLGKNGGISM